MKVGMDREFSLRRRDPFGRISPSPPSFVPAKEAGTSFGRPDRRSSAKRNAVGPMRNDKKPLTAKE